MNIPFDVNEKHEVTIEHSDLMFYYPHPRGRRVQYLVCVSVCLCVTTKLL